MAEFWEFKEVLEGEIQVQASVHDNDFASRLLCDFDDLLHALSQPITVLLCTLELGSGLDSVDEIKPLLAEAREASERLRMTSLAMRSRLQLALRQE